MAEEPIDHPGILAGLEKLKQFRLRKPEFWERETGIRVLDADGWDDLTTWDQLITREEFERRASHSTCEHMIKKEDGE